MQRKDVERLADSLDTFAQHYPGLAKDAANALRTLLAERDALRAAIFGGTDYATDLTNGNFIEMAQTTEAARLGALARAEKAEAERDAVFAAGQEDMRERAVVVARTQATIWRQTIAPPIKDGPDGR